MAKGLRSKCKRIHRTEFRRTIGQQALDKNMDIVQAKLKECIEKGNMNSFERLSIMFNGADESVPDSSTSLLNDDDTDVASMDTSPGVGVVTTGKSADKIPVKKAKSFTNKKKLLIPNAFGSTGAALARKQISKANRRGQMKNGRRVVKKKVRIARKNKCAY